jgi:hypothetical protein
MDGSRGYVVKSIKDEGVSSVVIMGSNYGSGGTTEVRRGNRAVGKFPVDYF